MAPNVPAVRCWRPHVVMISHPRTVADLIQDAATATT